MVSNKKLGVRVGVGAGNTLKGISGNEMFKLYKVSNFFFVCVEMLKAVYMYSAVHMPRKDLKRLYSLTTG